ncbi:hypothetical protein DUZ99_16560 [Xylanibacillus composti]|uniref:Uncharacterized protein n=1 Tax=Xylanibacillus composti TaxID=1572762 RepID=A0A8J4H3S0_9BACL|nr:hypothetical protein [Xylanibacillus composti]MDT9726591.1 hypothetical protein [Xylanibacillus composti]GIQ69011.1 hypothetical protein XYCOK13_18350 [Xylanibacillus composti]
MDNVTLNHEQFLSFTGWSESHCMKQTVRSRLQKLQNMGVKDVKITGMGKRAEYTLSIPAGFWYMLLINGMSYSPIGAEYIDCIINGRDLVNTAKGTFVKFTNELYMELAQRHEAEYKAVEATCTRIRNSLREHGYITDSHMKTHRVKRVKLIEGKFVNEWVADDEAIVYDQRARAVWTSFFQKKLNAYRKINPEAESVPIYLIAQEVRKVYSFEMAEQLGVEYYRVAKKTEATANLHADISFARNTFLQARDLQAVRKELLLLQQAHRSSTQQLKEHEEHAKAELKAHQPSKEALKELQQQMFVAEVQNESMAPPITEEERKQMEALLDELIPNNENEQ